jgi:hypothetical protein
MSNDTSKARSDRNRNATDAPRSASLDPDVSAETSSRTPQQQRIEAQRAQLLQAHGVLRCLYEVLLHAECDDAVFYAEAAHVAANLINNTAEELDSVHSALNHAFPAFLRASGGGLQHEHLMAA